jgi:hypothetical protein
VEEKITIEASCGKTFEMSPAEMTASQLRGLIESNPDGDPDIIAALRAELERRR